MNPQSLYESAHKLMLERLPWEQKQRIFSTMRREGLRRRNKPFPTAADGHYPAIDMAIRKQKPFWLGQVTSGQRLASFCSMANATDALAEQAADFFHYRLFQQTKFMAKLRVVVDMMLLRGRGVLKVTVDPFDGHKLTFEAVDPMFLIVPEMAADLEEADEFVHVQQWSLGRYRRNRRFDQSPQTIEKIKGVISTETLTQYVREKSLREGITHTTDEKRIVLWEHWMRTDGGWTVHTYSPQHPDLPIRKPFGCPYKDAEGKILLPFIPFQMEVVEEGWYSPRGLGELLAPIESYLTKLWNEKADSITFSNRPVLTSDGAIPNSANIRWQPGEIIPQNLRGVQMPVPPFSYDAELNFSRGIGEQQAMTPDFGITDQSDMSKPRTATENERISALHNAGMNDNALMFRDSLTKVYRLCWALMVQFKGNDFAYFAANKVGTLPEAAFAGQYVIMPDGSPDGWNRQQRMQKAVSRMQAYAGNPNVSAEELTREALAADDPRLAIKAFIPTNQKAANEAEDEAVEISILQDGFPAAVTPGEDHATRIMVDIGWLQKQEQTGAPVDPLAKQRVEEHLAIHWQYLQKTNPQAARHLAQQFQAMVAQPQQITPT